MVFRVSKLGTKSLFFFFLFGRDERARAKNNPTPRRGRPSVLCIYPLYISHLIVSYGIVLSAIEMAAHYHTFTYDIVHVYRRIIHRQDNTTDVFGCNLVLTLTFFFLSSYPHQKYQNNTPYPPRKNKRSNLWTR